MPKLQRETGAVRQRGPFRADYYLELTDTVRSEALEEQVVAAGPLNALSTRQSPRQSRAPAPRGLQKVKITERTTPGRTCLNKSEPWTNAKTKTYGTNYPGKTCQSRSRSRANARK